MGGYRENPIKNAGINPVLWGSFTIRILYVQYVN